MLCGSARTSERCWSISNQAEAQPLNKIKLTFGSLIVHAELDETETVRKLLKALPCESTVNTWGEEVYFSVPVETVLEPDARQVVDAGTVCFWVEGNSLAIPYGPTPVSEGDECRLVTEVNVLGRLEEPARSLASVRDGDGVIVELV